MTAPRYRRNVEHMSWGMRFMIAAAVLVVVILAAAIVAIGWVLSS